MSKLNLFTLKNMGILGVVCGSLLLAPLGTSAKPMMDNQTEGNSTTLPNKPSINRTDDSLVPAAQPPLPENQTPAIAIVTPKNGMVNINLKNTTNTPITYQIIGHTEQRSLTGKQQEDLRELPLPVTITIVREDGGLVDITPKTSQVGILEVTLKEDPKLDSTQGVIQIQEDGQVFVN